MIQQLCEPEHMIIVIIVLLVALLVVGSGRSLGKFIGPVLKRWFGSGGTEINLNLGDDMTKKHQGPVCLVDPTKCTAHEAEHERSISNEAKIEKLFTCVSEVKKEVRDGNERILLALVASGHIRPQDIPKI
jgi:hypothetical protein